MKVATVNISFPRPLLKAMDRMAKEEARTRSELLREAARAYLERKARWERIFSFSERQARRVGLKPSDVEKAIQEARQRSAHR